MSATFVAQSYQSPITDKNIANLYSKLFDDIRTRKEKVPLELDEFFAKESTNLETIRIGENSPTLPLPIKNEDTDHIPMVTPLEGHYKEFTNVLYRLGFQITRSAVSRQKTRMIMSLLTGLPNSAARKQMYAMADLFNNGFATHTTGDGAYIFADAHNDGNEEAATWDNNGTAAAFTTDSHFLAWQHFQNMTDARGFPQPQEVDAVLFPVALAEDVEKVHISSKYPQNSLNAEVPAFIRNFRPVVCHWLTSSTAWFVHGSTQEGDKGFTMVWEEKPSYTALSYPSNPDIIMGRRLRMSFSVGALHARDWYGNSGA